MDKRKEKVMFTYPGHRSIVWRHFRYFFTQQKLSWRTLERDSTTSYSLHDRFKRAEGYWNSVSIKIECNSIVYQKRIPIYVFKLNIIDCRFTFKRGEIILKMFKRDLKWMTSTTRCEEFIIIMFQSIWRFYLWPMSKAALNVVGNMKLDRKI